MEKTSFLPSLSLLRDFCLTKKQAGFVSLLRAGFEFGVLLWFGFWLFFYALEHKAKSGS